MSNRLFITALILLAFVGQIVTVGASPCSMDMPSMNMTGMNINTSDPSSIVDHSMHQAQPDNESECFSDCNCPMASCLSVLISSDTIVSSTVTINQSFDVNASLAIITQSKSLYRPPITR